MSTFTFPGGTSVSMLDVYDDPAPDGLCGGSPHMHLASTEAYIVTGGNGRLQTLTAHGFEEKRLRRGSIIWFTPGTIHRAVNDGGLSLIVLMSNAGLPEAGDAVLSFPPVILASESAYAEAVDLGDGDDAIRRERASRRRDLAVEGFTLLRTAAENGRAESFRAFLDAAGRLVRARATEWPGLIRENALEGAEDELAAAQLVALGEPAYLLEAEVRSAPVRGTGVLGMCGRLRTFDTRGSS